MISKDNTVLLDRILESTDLISKYTAGITQEEFKNDPKTKDAVLMQLIVIGEVVTRLPANFRATYNNIEWMRISRTGPIIAHEYGKVDYEVIWRIATIHIPVTKQYIEEIYPKSL